MFMILYLSRMTLIYIIDLLGTLVFAISGALAAANKRMDVFGASVIAFVTAVGGGTIRDVLIGSQPVGWMKDLNYLLMIGIGIGFAFLFKKGIQQLRRTFFLFDTVGIGLFTILGLQKTLGLGLSPVIAVMMGTVSAVFGGVLRDTLSNEIPLIFRKE
ncbi:MAG: trimeric intracellular cation channel family protein, partial [Bacteroidota bacterium]